MGRGALVVVTGAVICLGAVASSAATLKNTPGCGPTRATTLIEGRKARVYSLPGREPPETERVLGCSTAALRSWKLSPFGKTKFGGALLGQPVLLRGLWAGGLFRSHGIDTYRLSVRSRNLRTGAETHCGVGGGIAPRRGSWVTSVVLTEGGSLAWAGERPILERIPSSGPQYETPGSPVSPPSAVSRRIKQKQIVACGATGEEVLDSGEGIDLNSLNLHGSALSWRNAGEPRMAVLP